MFTNVEGEICNEILALQRSMNMKNTKESSFFRGEEICLLEQLTPLIGFVVCY
jgi:hypothetical protein